MKDFEQLVPFRFYKNTVLSPIKITDSNKKVSTLQGNCFLIISDNSERTIQKLQQSTPFKYWIRNIKGFYSDYYTKLNLPGILGKKEIKGRIQLYKNVRVSGRPYISTFYPALSKLDNKNFYWDLSTEFTKFNEYKASDLIFGRKMLEYFKTIQEQVPNDYQNIYAILECDSDKKTIIIKILKILYKFFYMLKLAKEVFAERFNIKFCLVLPDNTICKIVFNDEPINKNRMAKVIDYLEKLEKTGKVEKFEDFEEESLDKTDPVDNSLNNTELTIKRATTNTKDDITIKPKEISKEKIDPIEFQENIKNQLTINIKKDEKNIDIINQLESNLNNIINTEIETNSNITSEELIKKINNSKEIKSIIKELDSLNKLEKIIEEKIKKLLENQLDSKIKINDGSTFTLKEILEASDTSLKIEKFPNINSVNEEVKSSSVFSLNKNYIDKLMLRDLSVVLSSLSNNNDNPLFLQNVEIIDNSDSFNKLNLVKCTYIDKNNKRYNISFNIPKPDSYGTLLLNGSKKFIVKQFISVPVVKKKPYQVQFTSFYKKAFFERKGNKVLKNIEKIKKLVNLNQKISNLKIVTGNAFKLSQQRGDLFFDELSKILVELKFKEYTINFNIDEAEALMLEKFNNEKSVNNLLKNSSLLAFKKDFSTVFIYENETYYDVKIDKETGKILRKQQADYSFEEFLFELLKKDTPEFYEEILNVSVGKAYAFTLAEILDRSIPVSILLAYKDGLEKFLQEAKINYNFTEKKVILKEEEKIKFNTISFKDGTLVYEANKPEISLLMSGFRSFSTKEYTFEEMNMKEPYLTYFEITYDSRNLGKGIENWYKSLVDPITAELLEKQNIPSDVKGLVLYINKLLSTNTKKKVIDVSNYRIRSMEIINQAVYQELHNAYNTYKNDLQNSSHKNNFSIKKDGVVKQVIQSRNVEPLSLLSPIISLEQVDKVTFKGLGGINLEDTFTSEYRAFDESMKGTFGIYTPISSQSGINRVLTYNTDILDVRGFIDSSFENKTSSGSLGTIELLNPFTAVHSDFPRIAMAGTQNSHITPTLKQNKPIVTSGVTKTLPYIINDDFAFKAKKDGIIEKIDKKTELVTIRYKDGTKGLIDLKVKIVKNVKMGFYVQTQLSLTFKENEKFKAGEILAYDKQFFKPEFNDEKIIEYSPGLLKKVALTSDGSTFEDSIMISREVSQELAFPIVLDKIVTLGKNARITKMAKKGDVLKASDPLMIFESSFNEKEINQILSKLDSEFGQDILDLGRNFVSSKLSGKIIDIKVYYNIPYEELSESLQKVVDNFKTENKRRSDIATKINSPDIVNIDRTEQISYDKVFGESFEGVMVQFFIKSIDECTTGDKLSFQVALKGTVSEIFDKDSLPTSEYDVEEPIHAVMSPLSVVSRMTMDFYLNLYCNKVLVDLKKKCKDIWEK
jgi:hypothetical protein